MRGQSGICRNVAVMSLCAVLSAAGGASAQGFTTAAEVRPILDMTRASWVAVREYEGQDLVYFTHLIAWRCGLSAVHYGLNGAAPETPATLEPCYDGTAQPAEIKMPELMYIAQPLGSVQTLTVRLTFDDGTEDSASFERAAVMTP